MHQGSTSCGFGEEEGGLEAAEKLRGDVLFSSSRICPGIFLPLRGVKAGSLAGMGLALLEVSVAGSGFGCGILVPSALSTFGGCFFSCCWEIHLPFIWRGVSVCK